MEIQRTFLTLGQNGCYFFCLWKIITKYNGYAYHDPLLLYDRCVYKGYLREDCWVENPAKILEDELGGKWEVRKEGPEYERQEGEIVVLRYERKSPMGAASHFVLQEEGGSIWDPLGESETVRTGYVQSKRVFRRRV